MTGRAVGTPQELTRFLTLLDWQEPGWRLDGHVTHCGGVGSHVNTVSLPSNEVLRGGVQIIEGPL